MRIISGDLGGRRINPPSQMPHTRPTTDVAKEGLFNVIENNLDITRLRTLDLFGGTGCISYELASRGARDLMIVEKDPRMQKFIAQTCVNLELDNLKLIKAEVFSYIETCREKFDFIFAGPPYSLAAIDRLPEMIFRFNLLEQDGWFVLEHTPRNDYRTYPFYKTERNYGTTIFSIFVNSIPAN